LPRRSKSCWIECRPTPRGGSAAERDPLILGERFNQAVFTRIDVRDGKIAAVGYHPPFNLLFSSSEFEYGDLVEAMGLEPTNLLTASQALYQLSYAPMCEGKR
jgi:hypothetical protein